MNPGVGGPYRESDYHPGATVFSADGVHVGILDHVVVDHETWELREVIVKETRRSSGHLFAPGTALLTDDIIVPVREIHSVAHDRVDLALTASEIRRLPPYLSYTYAPAGKGDALRKAVSLAAGTPYLPTLLETARKTARELEINPGENIMLGQSGQKLGQVRDLLFDGSELVGVVMHPHAFFHEDVVLQVRFLDRSDDLALFAHLSHDDLAKLQPFHPQ